jgi:hypothetical protein
MSIADPVIRPARADEASLLEDIQRRASLAWDDHREDLLEQARFGPAPVLEKPLT